MWGRFHEDPGPIGAALRALPVVLPLSWPLGWWWRIGRVGDYRHFVACIEAIRARTPETKIEILVPDFRGRMERALGIMEQSPPDVFNHNLETVPRLYREVRPGADYD